MTSHEARHNTPFIARWIRRLALPIILGWLAVAFILNTAVPPLEQVERARAISETPVDAPSFQAMERMGELFGESTSDAVAMIVLEGQDRLGDDVHAYYGELIRQLRADTEHVRHIRDFWADPLTAAAAESADGKAVYVQLTLHGNVGQASANESVAAVRGIVDRTPPPPGVQVYLTGPAPFTAEMGETGNATVILITLVSLGVILVMLLLFFRSIATVIVVLLSVGIQLQVARGVVAFLGDIGAFGLSTFVVNLLVALLIAAGTDYGIFFFGRYHEALEAGEDRETAFYSTFRGTAKVVLGSGLTIAGALLCLSFTRLPSFKVLGVPSAVGVVTAVMVALTLTPAIIAVGGRFKWFEPKRKIKVPRWRRVGTAIVRWPAPILAASCAVALVGLLALPGYQPTYNDQESIPKDIPAAVGLQAAQRHFPASQMSAPDVLLVEADHDMRNPTDFLILNKLAKGVLAVPGVASVQGPTRPAGTPLEHTSIPYMLSMSQASQMQMMPFQRARMDEMLDQAEDMAATIALMKRMYGLMQELAATTHSMVEQTHELQETTYELRDQISNFDDFFRPIRNYFYWEPHCFNIPICWSLRSIFDGLDGVDKISAQMDDLMGDLDTLDTLMPQMISQFPPMIATMESTRTMMLTMHSTMSGMMAQMDEGTTNATAMGKAFDAAMNDDSFYLPEEVFQNKDFKRVMDVFLSPDGKAARLLISQRGDPASRESMALVDPIQTAGEEALKGTPLENAKVSLTGSAAMVKDIVDGSTYDLLIAAISALCLIFTIMLIMTRSLFAALVIVGTVALSLGSAFGLSVLVWQHILGIQIHWAVLVMAVICLLAVGSDYNLLLVSRMKEEVGAGINTGIIRAMAGTGRVVTAAGLVFSFTMLSMVVSDLRTVGQLGSTIGLGLMFDTLVVRAFMTPSIAALLGRWFWWPQRVRQRPASSLLRPIGPRPLVRSLLLTQER
ncbi:RND family transporter [Mycolicibacterium sp. ND9-15]|uniref:MMPL/RND family transporter n=1 Tax=Mycolicibacterium sp. ND9-15 TaxID=3042320 RepID=UPI002DDAC417|nr:RND family transporter [Mycolicibacterium sp. ND9-15]WSE54911.1 RND family transporter [Mycolicibacterium sp. ND9-15]